MDILKEFKNRFGNKHLFFERSESGLVLMKVDHPLATATISLEGGQVLEWQPKSQLKPVLWSADPAHWQKGRAIRAGVPICWPWFGAHPSDPVAPSHGFARLCSWEITHTSTSPLGQVEIWMAMPATYQSTTHHALNLTLTIRISIGETLSISLTTSNTSDHPIFMTEALHAYFNVSDIRNIQIQGLAGYEYIDLIDRNMRKTQNDSIRFSEETGQVYVNTKSECLLIDPEYDRIIKIEKTGSQSTVVWNPWLDTAEKMSDLGREQWQKMVCIESANALDDGLRIEAGDQHTLSVKYCVE